MAVASGASNVVPIVRSCKSLARLSKLGTEYRRGDVSCAQSLESAISGCHVVLNLTIDDAVKIAANTKTICEACEKQGVQLLIHISSAEVFGRADNPHINDDSPPDLHHWMAYARGKGRAEVILRQQMHRAPFAIVVLRPGLIWGPRSSWAATTALDLMEERAFLASGGTGICNLMFVDNFIYSILGIMQHPTPPSGFYNVSDDEEVTWAYFYDQLTRGLNLDARKITAIRTTRYVPSLTERLRELRQTKTMHCFNAIIPTNLRPLLEKQARRALGLFNSNGANMSSQPRVTRSLWQLQLTRHKLSTQKFNQTFGRQNKYTFAQAMKMTCSWLRFAGFALTPESGGNQS